MTGYQSMENDSRDLKKVSIKKDGGECVAVLFQTVFETAQVFF